MPARGEACFHFPRNVPQPPDLLETEGWIRSGQTDEEAARHRDQLCLVCQTIGSISPQQVTFYSKIKRINKKIKTHVGSSQVKRLCLHADLASSVVSLVV